MTDKPDDWEKMGFAPDVSIDSSVNKRYRVYHSSGGTGGINR